ncbi:hypothetical protein [Emticicia agri]|uniref:Restriction endonuclease n=1 Tax=Emticicia agri TaxID=2492393 RepID=A0A4Q5LVV7_9BACT|nr:hypothetical protein [Emticicia agri]RYU93804.1 hypothetical protein EWM59_19990 [Emticicia agri]
MQKLFDEKERHNIDFAKHQHNSYDFYNDTAREEFVAVRNRLEDWFSRYPDSDKKQLKRDLQTRFEPAFFELFIHELFYRQGFTLTVHPDIPDSTRKPDFLAKKGEIAFYIEAKIAYDDFYEKVVIAKQSSIYDKLNEIDSAYIGICIEELYFLSTNQPRLNKIKTFFQQAIHEYTQQEPEDTETIERQIYEDNDVKIVFSLLTVETQLIHTCISEPPIVFLGGCEEQLKKSIIEKAYRYGNLDKPFLICINSLSYKKTSTEDVYNALFGNYRRMANIENLNQDFKTSSDGIFAPDSAFSCKNASGVFITAVNEHNLAMAKHWLVRHPFTKNAFDMDALDLSYIHVNNKKIEEVKKLSIGQLMV